MKKETRTLLIVLGIVFVLPVLLVGMLFFASVILPEKWVARIRNSHRDQTVSPYPFADAGLPDAPTACESSSGLRLYLPGDLSYEKTDAKGLLYTDADKGLTQTARVYVKFTKPADSYKQRVKPVYLEEGIWAFSASKPENEYELWDFILNLTEEQFDEPRQNLSPAVQRARSLYITAVGAKENAWKRKSLSDDIYRTEDIYRFEHETAKGFVLLLENEESVPAEYALDLWLYDKNDLNRCCRAVLYSGDMQLLAQIANTAEIVPNGGNTDDE